MWLFKKKKVIDMTERQLRQLRTPKPSGSSSNLPVSGYKDLTSSSDSALGFLGSIASSALGTSSSSDFSSVSSSGLSSLNKSSPEHLRVKIEDIEYKINSLKNRIDKILDRLDLAEKKIERQERR